MPEPFKNFFNPSMIRKMAEHLKQADQAFDQGTFITIATKNLDSLELKERSNQIRQALEASLPSDYRRTCKLMLASLYPEPDLTPPHTEEETHGLRSWAIMPMADYIARHGLDDFDFSMDVLKSLTKRFSSELAIRSFLLADTPRALRHINTWTNDSNVHVRRLASEGTRPRLPWGIQLPMFIQNPSPILPILEALKKDPEEYVRRSVANNLNDIAKDHPNVVSNIASQWIKKADVNQKRLIRHACRTLIKQGHQGTLEALGYTKPQIRFESLNLKKTKISLGNHLEFTLSLASDSPQTQSLIIDYVVHHRKANGTTSPKVFKWKEVDLVGGKNLAMTKKHTIKKITTRVYYPGLHQLEIQINGENYGRAEFELEL